ncbi:hypothetical protein CHARACLAT_030843 [Characodon lateralis]|uniref:Uncharacterized protein n=1 Tax=Characodon lateralis TaxID=208331 RepID=A0ABU7F9D6_9TELE|nr:hypothetical protein [Characodon lateralis]
MDIPLSILAKASAEVFTVILDNSPFPQQRQLGPPRFCIIPQPQPLFIKNMLCLQSRFQSNFHYLPNKLVKLFSPAS